MLNNKTIQDEKTVGSSSSGVWIYSILLIQAAAALWIGLPGQMSTDSIIQLYEGRSHETISFHPPLMSILLGVLDRFGDAPVGFVLISQALLSWCTWLVLTSGGRQPWWRFLLAAIFMLNPVVLAYVGIVWKDVLFAHVNVLLFLLLARWQSTGVHMGPGKLVLSVGLLTVVVGLRQQGILFAVVAACWVASMLRLSKTKSVMAALALALAPLILNSALTSLVQKPFPGSAPVSSVGFKILMFYDLVGIVANRGELAKEIDKTIVDEVQQQIPNYSPNRVDGLRMSEKFMVVPLLSAQRIWRKSITENFGAYIRHRWRVTEAIMGMANMRACLPIESGVGGPVLHPMVPQELTSLLGLETGHNHSSAIVIATAWELANTPLFMHWAYALVLAGACLVLVRRRAYVLLSLAICSLIFLASYAVLSIACDFRYVFTLTEATSLLAAWAVLAHPNPRLTDS
jgi:hypothetical protein